MNQVVQHNYIQTIDMDGSQLYEPLQSIYDVLLECYSKSEVEREPTLQVYGTIEKLEDECDQLQGLYITLQVGRKKYEFLYSLQQMITAICIELRQINSLGKNYVLNDWTSILIYQLKLVLDIMEQQESAKSYRISKLTRPLAEIKEQEQRSLVSRLARRLRGIKESATKYSAYTQRPEELRRIVEAQSKTRAETQKYQSPHVAHHQAHGNMVRR